MEFAALASFAILFVAWVLAPDHPRPAEAVAETPALEPEPVPATA
jgi:hypothetical protein